MDPATAYLIGSIGSSLLGGLLGGGDDENFQRRQSFRGTGLNSDPVMILQDLVGGSKQLGGALSKKASNPAPFRGSFVPNVPGLPSDPGANDTSFLNIPGLEGLSDFLGTESNPFATAKGYTGRTRRRMPWELPEEDDNPARMRELF